MQKDLAKSDAKRLDLKFQFLNQAYIFQLISFWQVFIEELAKYSFRQIENLEHGGIFRDIAKLKLDQALKKFNTPSKENIDSLFNDTLGVIKVSSHWHSEKLTQEVAVRTLGELLRSRHEIAHTGRASSTLSYEENFEKMEILMEIAELTEKVVIEELTSRSKYSLRSLGPTKPAI